MCSRPSLQAKKAREQAALKNAQILFDQLDAEKEKKESRRNKKRDKRKKKKQRAGKTESMVREERVRKSGLVQCLEMVVRLVCGLLQEVEKEGTGLPVEGRLGPDGEEGEGSGTPPQPPPSPEFVTSGEVSGMCASGKQRGSCPLTCAL